LRGDFAIILGQMFSYYIYIWNLNSKGYWKEIMPVIRIVLQLIPVVALSYVLYHSDKSLDRLFGNIPLGLVLFGSAGQIVLTLRFVYQWWHSRTRGESLLPVNFWLLSLVGSLLTIAYGIFRLDPVLIIGQSAGFVSYSRNLWLAIKKQ
jgi:lipid-A-disaccharide synthase-like uncharacterized protein